MRPLLSAVASVLAVFVAFVAGVSAVADAPQDTPTTGQIELGLENIEARAALVYDPASGRVLYQKNAIESLPLASLAKLMTAQAVLAAYPENAYFPITRENLRPEGDSGLRPGERLTLTELIDLALVASSNDAAAAAAAAFDEPAVELNKTAERLALTKTHFLNPTGLDIDGDSAGARGSAYDMARLAAAFYKKYPTYFEQTARGSVTVQAAGHTIVEDATTAPLQNIPGFVGAKTGYTELAGGNLVAIVDMEIGRPVVAVVLGSSREGRFKDIKTLITAARNNYGKF
ncbi:hypothetical protein A2852_02360 [Candidatus Adlerbacteria bacterium RIFCSPHIGHO2_01_FULL_54_23]|uniref:Peptidase S11 D-alanyl-D-alanine carboxypeptidase A N-terminal domain-containing protein n=3 Tax=Candidatus Adleribacteriota TaxID=1752736 RepID=A0A1F4Y0X4_9BACT|nr:MAG: Serine-type D-Ala-D-Ala carboxypeptidase [Candidatus Adlerbacteria bacterium GW2011_GWA1_54_10]KKW37961.1 MAG: Serine-type D-Ala-D-Ala carboxypeptidase [Candidatus Adlerbacteria bacterium GW2011_GWB1_54_7]OGC78569.1 MAG: hypothetical protein A2852_02360 [Candidatus Adlerbacteria bacterium RIFCSPHIGHO2_01_FULL_54_23]OGC87579.1 MAG: hypothetical protein A3B33_01555 [Candidatus Adlerbacteria bacterium RIFCSPLOWO2_01_FULL_54_16]